MVAPSDNFNNRSRRSSTDQDTLSSSSLNNSVSDTANLLSNMHITLPDPRIYSPKVRRSPVTPPSVTPPSVSTDISSIQIQQLERDRCKSPSQRTASALLAKVAVLPFVPSSTAPMATASGMCSPGLTSSNSSTPASSPPGEGDQFSFGSFPKSLPASPNGGYVSFPDFDQFGDCNSDDEDSCPMTKH